MLRPALAVLTFAALSACATTATAPKTDKTCYHLNDKIETEIGYCQAVRSGNTLHISGSVGAGDMPAAMHKAYDTLRKTLVAHGLDFRDVVKENVYATDLDAFIKNEALRKEYYGADFPAATWVQVQRLYLPAFTLEIELTAEYPARAR